MITTTPQDQLCKYFSIWFVLQRVFFLVPEISIEGLDSIWMLFVVCAFDHHIKSYVKGHWHYFDFMNKRCEFTCLHGKGSSGGWHNSEPFRGPRICATPETSILLLIVSARQPQRHLLCLNSGLFKDNFDGIFCQYERA